MVTALAVAVLRTDPAVAGVMVTGWAAGWLGAVARRAAAVSGGPVAESVPVPARGANWPGW
jgi:hypothetical protein